MTTELATISILSTSIAHSINTDEVTTGQLLTLAHALLLKASADERAMAEALSPPIPGLPDFAAIVSARADNLDAAVAAVKDSLTPIDI